MPSGARTIGVMGPDSEAQKQALGTLVDHPVADRLGEEFAAAGEQLYLVGGFVRDALRGATDPADAHDLDFATSARPEVTERLLRGWTDAVWLTGARFGTVSARRGDVTVEVTTFRADAYTRGSRHPDVAFGEEITADLSRRDFTVNAIAVQVPDRRVVDPFDGWADLRAGLLRTPVDAEASFADDPLRMVRLARFAATLGFTPSDDAVKAASVMADAINEVSAERIRDELDRLLCGAHVSRGVDLLVDTGLADRFLPEVPALRMERDPLHHHKDVYRHTMAVVEGVPAEDPILRMAALLHDIGKPATREFQPGGKVTFHHHEVVGARMARARLRALRYPKETVQQVGDLVFLHLRFHGYADGDWTDSAVRRYVRDAGSPEQLRRLNQLTRADVTTRDRAKARRFARAMDDLEERIARLREQEEFERLRPPLDGHQIMAHLGLEPGPLIGEAWNYLLERRVEQGPLSEEQGYALLQQWARTKGLR